MKTVAVTGASGFLGSAVVDTLRGGAHKVIALSRDPSSGDFPDDVETRRFDPSESAPDPSAFAGVDAVVNLSGESISGRWTRRKKHAIASSRIEGTKRLVESLAAYERRPEVLVSASAVGYYGSRGDKQLVEGTSAGNDFLADVCVKWEAAAREAQDLGIRTVVMRFGVILGDGGALQQMKMPFLLGIGGPMGWGQQFLPWIHVDDAASLIAFAIETKELSGPVNAVAPDLPTNARFAHALGAALKRPAFLPVPGFALRIVLGEFAGTLLASQRVLPAAARSAGFQWRYPNLEQALTAVFR